MTIFESRRDRIFQEYGLILVIVEDYAIVLDGAKSVWNGSFQNLSDNDCIKIELRKENSVVHECLLMFQIPYETPYQETIKHPRCILNHIIDITIKIAKKRKNKLLELLKVNVTSQNFRRSSIQNSQPATERLLNIAPSVISNLSGHKAEPENDQEYDVYVDISELENKPSPIESSPTIYESFEDLYEGRFPSRDAWL